MPNPGKSGENACVYQDGRTRVYRGIRTTELLRPPSLKTKDHIPREAVRAARDVIEHGYTVKETANGPRRIVRVAVVTVCTIGGVAMLIATLVASRVMPHTISGIPWVAGFALLFVAASTFLDRKWAPSRLSGRSIAKKGRHSTELWAIALGQVDAGKRDESELPAVHRAAIAIANAEDKVSRLVNKNKYDLNQGPVDQARSDLALKVAQLRDTLGLPALSDEPSYLSNRWAEIAGVVDTQPVNPDDLR